MIQRLVPKVLGNVTDRRFTPGSIHLEKRAFECETVPEKDAVTPCGDVPAPSTTWIGAPDPVGPVTQDKGPSCTNPL